VLQAVSSVAKTVLSSVNDLLKGKYQQTQFCDKVQSPQTQKASLNLPSGSDWYSLPSWNYIHNQVQKDIASRYPDIQSKELYLPGVGRADLYDTKTHEIWEVKPASYQYGPKLDTGLAQLNKYVGVNDMFVVGGSSIAGNIFIIENGQYIVEYENMQNGLIVYTFQDNAKKPQSVSSQGIMSNGEKKEQVSQGVTAGPIEETIAAIIMLGYLLSGGAVINPELGFASFLLENGTYKYTSSDGFMV
jgi:hypothetical protein